MTKELLISQLRQGSNGSEILQILEVLSTGMDSSDINNEPTLEEIEF